MDRTIKYNVQSRGFTLVELILYMGLFTVLVSGVLYSSFYLQSVLQYNSTEYKAQENIYRQLELLQHHLAQATKVEVSTSSIRMYNSHGYVVQGLHSGILHMIYTYEGKPEKDIDIYPFMNFSEFSFKREIVRDTLLTKSVVHVHIERVDIRGKVKGIDEYFIVPYLTTIPTSS